MDVWWEARQQVIQRVVDGARGDDVVIVEDKVDGIAGGVERIEQRRQQAMHRWGLWSAQQRGHGASHPWIGAFERGDSIGPEADQIVVVLVEGNPGDGPP